MVIDDSGSPGFYATVAVQDETVTIHRGDDSELRAEREIDATGRVVSPGFIDLHSHAGLTILGEPHHDPKVRQGVTTELVGVDGISHAPFRDARRAAPLHLAPVGAERLPTGGGRLADRRRPALPVRRPCRHQHRLHPRQLARPHLERRLGEPAGEPGGTRGHAGRHPRGDAGGGVGALDRPRLPARGVRLDRGV